MSALTQDRVKTALQEALAAQPGKKDSKWTGSDEAAAMGGVIEFLQNYMENDGKIEVEGKEKLKGQAARLALTALDFANRCGGLTLTLHEQMAAADLPKRRGSRKSTIKPTSTSNASKKKRLERELDLLIEDIGLDNDDNYMMIDVTYEVAADQGIPGFEDDSFTNADVCGNNSRDNGLILPKFVV